MTEVSLPRFNTNYEFSVVRVMVVILDICNNYGQDLGAFLS